MVQSATDETREIQNAHRLRLQDLKSRISEMEKTRGEMMDYLAKMIEELQKTQDYASQSAPLVPIRRIWPRLMPSRSSIFRPIRSMRQPRRCAAVSRSRSRSPAPADPDTNRVVAPGLDDAEPRTNTVITPSPDYFDTDPKEQPGDPHEEVEIPGAIFSYPILRQQGEPILDEETPPQPVPHKPVMPSFTLADEDELDNALPRARCGTGQAAAQAPPQGCDGPARAEQKDRCIRPCRTMPAGGCGGAARGAGGNHETA